MGSLSKKKVADETVDDAQVSRSLCLESMYN
jgi:hypothetical protein